MKKKLVVKRIEHLLNFKLTAKDIEFIESEFNWLEKQFNLIQPLIYEGVEEASTVNTKTQKEILKQKEIRELNREVILKNAEINVSENKYITYPKK